MNLVPILEVAELNPFPAHQAKQRRLPAILDKLKAIRLKRQKSLQLVDDFLKSRFVEMFGDPMVNLKGWEQKPLYATLEEGSFVTNGIAQTGNDTIGGVPVLRPIDITDGKIPKLNDLKRTTKDISVNHARTLLRGYELLITVGSSIGETFQVTPEFAGCNVTWNIVPLRLNTKILQYTFMENLIKQQSFRKALADKRKGIALQCLNMCELREIEIILPPLPLQNRFVEFVRLADNSKLPMKKSLEELGTLQKTIKREYFGR